MKRLRLLLRLSRSLPPLVDFCSKRNTFEKECLTYKRRSDSGSSVSLDLGCGRRPRNPFDADVLNGVDISADLPDNASVNEIKQADLTLDPIPYPSGQCDYVTAFDFIEHLPRQVTIFRNAKPAGLPHAASRLPFIEIMNEIYRVLNPGGLFLSVTPAWPFPDAFKDPTHVNFITYDTFPSYFCGNSMGRYGFEGNFNLIKQGWLGYKLVSLLQKRPV